MKSVALFLIFLLLSSMALAEEEPVATEEIPEEDVVRIQEELVFQVERLEIAVGIFVEVSAELMQGVRDYLKTVKTLPLEKLKLMLQVTTSDTLDLAQVASDISDIQASLLSLHSMIFNSEDFYDKVKDEVVVQYLKREGRRISKGIPALVRIFSKNPIEYVLYVLKHYPDIQNQVPFLHGGEWEKRLVAILRPWRFADPLDFFVPSDSAHPQKNK